MEDIKTDCELSSQMPDTLSPSERAKVNVHTTSKEASVQHSSDSVTESEGNICGIQISKTKNGDQFSNQEDVGSQDSNITQVVNNTSGEGTDRKTNLYDNKNSPKQEDTDVKITVPANSSVINEDNNSAEIRVNNSVGEKSAPLKTDGRTNSELIILSNNGESAQPTDAESDMAKSCPNEEEVSSRDQHAESHISSQEAVTTKMMTDLEEESGDNVMTTDLEGDITDSIADDSSIHGIQSNLDTNQSSGQWQDLNHLSSKTEEVDDRSEHHKETEKMGCKKDAQMDYRALEPESGTTDTSSDSSGDESSSESSVSTGLIKATGDDNSDEEEIGARHKVKKNANLSWPQTLPRTKGELCLDDLPPIEELTVTVGDDVTMVEVGKITSAVHTLVIIQAKPDLPPLNEDTVLFLDGKKVLGQVFETFGPVTTPLYSVRFNTPDEIKERGLQPDLTVFYAPDAPEFTHYVFMAHLQSIKPSDASWEHNNEPPPQCIDYSDDEEERRAKGLLKQEKKHKTQEGDNVNVTKGKRQRRRGKGHHGYQENVVGSNSIVGPSKYCQSWPPKHRSAQANQNGYGSGFRQTSNPYTDMSEPHGNHDSHSDMPPNTQSGAWTGSWQGFRQSYPGQDFGRGQPMKLPRPPPAPGMAFPMRHPPPYRNQYRGSLMNRQPMPGHRPRTQSSRMHYPQSTPFCPVPRPGVVDSSVVSNMPQNEMLQYSQQNEQGPQHWNQHNAGHLPPTSTGNHTVLTQPYAMPPPTAHMEPNVMGVSHASNQSSHPGLNSGVLYTRPEHLAQQQFGGQPQFSRGPMGSWPPWTASPGYHQ